MSRSDLMKREFSRVLKELADSKPLESITVTELTKACGVSRGTFYNHFLDIYDLINWTFETDIIAPLQSYILEHKGTWSGITERCLFKMYENRSFYSQAVRNTGQNNLRDYMQQRNLDSWKLLIESYMGDSKKFDPETLNFIERYTAQGIANMVIAWAEQGMPIPPDKMSLMDLVATRGIYGVIDAAQLPISQQDSLHASEKQRS